VPYKILIVEDEGLIAHDIAGRLEDLGHEVIGTVATADEAVALASGADAVLMDIRIDGDRDGIEAAREIRERCHIPVIFLTAHLDRATLERAKLAEPFGYLVKPLGAASLQPAVEVAIYKHRMERQVAEHEAWLRTTLASTAEAVVATGADGRVRLLNSAAEALTGWTQAEAKDQPWSKVLRLLPADAEGDMEELAPLAILRDSPVELPALCRLVSRDGREIAVEGAVAPVRIAAEAGTVGTVTTFRDVSVRRWEENQLRQSQRAETAARLAAAASHDYNNLIAIIRTRSENLLMQFGEYSAALGPIEEIHQAAVAADQITRRLAAFGAREVSHPVVLSLNAMVRRMSRLIESIAGDHIRVRVRLSESAGEIRADPSQVEQAVVNLVLHACSTMPERGNLLLETGGVEFPQSGRMATYSSLALTYSGQEGNPERLFDPISIELAGLMLPLVQSIAAEHGGYVSAQPGQNGGTRLEMLLPSLRQLAVRGAMAEALAAGTGMGGSILLVDRRDSVRGQLHNFFESAGYNLLEAADAGEAIACGQLHEGALDLLIADAGEAQPILDALRSVQPAVRLLGIVDGVEGSVQEIRRPFTQNTLLNRVRAMLAQTE